MALSTMAGIHKVTVLTMTATVGAAMGVSRIFAAAVPPRILICTVTVLDSFEAMQLLVRGEGVLHKVHFAFDPQLDERNRLNWNGTTLRLIGLPQNKHGLNRLWVLKAVAKTEDNPAVEVQ